MLSKCCCCCISLHFGCRVMAIFGILSGIIQLTMLAEIDNLNWNDLEWGTFEYLLILFGITMPGGICHIATITAYQQFLNNRALAVVVCIVNIFTFSLLWIGAIMKSARMVFTCLISSVVLVIFGIISIIVMSKSEGMTHHSNGFTKITIGTCLFIGFLLNVYYWICVFSYHKRLKDKKGEVIF